MPPETGDLRIVAPRLNLLNLQLLNLNLSLTPTSMSVITVPLEPISPTRSGQLVVFTGPSGVGKGTLLRSVLPHHPQLHLSVSATTRSPRSGEVDGQHYYFVSRSVFQEWVTTEQLLEWAEYAGNYYGTPRQPVVEQLEQGKTVILEIELEGARQVRQTFPDALQVFILPPSLPTLEQRLRGRSQDSPESILKRLERAKVEIAAAGEFDVQIVNDSLDQAIVALETVLFSPDRRESDRQEDDQLQNDQLQNDRGEESQDNPDAL
jgi:guanylate kinase